MKRIFTLALALGCGIAMAQKSDNVGIGTTKPDPSALLELNSNSKGLLLPRMTENQRDEIKNPAIGLVIFQTDKAVGLYTYDGTTWTPSSARVGATAVAGAWDKQGNAIDATDFLGSTNNFPLRFRVNNTPSGFIDNTASGDVFLGLAAGLNARPNAVNNIAIGYQALRNVTPDGMPGTIGFNTAIGYLAMYYNKNGSGNIALGSRAMQNNVEGSSNVGIGEFALNESTLGFRNLALGRFALQRTQGSDNLAIGGQAGTTAFIGSRNVLIGAGAGNSVTSTVNDRLFIQNPSSTVPLIGGDFVNNFLKFHTGTTIPTATAGFVAIGDFSVDGAANTPGTGGINSFPNFTTGSRYRLVVQDGILTEKLKVALRNGSEWADYVFAADYKLIPLEEVEKYTKENKHLPNVPSAEDMVQKGLDVSEVSKVFMEKIEELTLYIIDLNKRIKELENKK